MAERLISDNMEAVLGTRLVRTRPMGGGCIGEVYKAELSDGSKAVAKVDRAGESHLEREAYMLRYLGEKSDLPVPEVYHFSERSCSWSSWRAAETSPGRKSTRRSC